MSNLETRPLVEAHRGDSSRAPENTLAAFERAVEIGVPWIELDVHPARDGTLAVIHDATVDRTTNGHGAVADMTFQELRRLDAGSWFGPEFHAQKIPRLEEVLEVVAPTGTRLNIEIKTFPAGSNVPAGLVRLLREFRREKDSVVSSFDLPALLEVAAVASDIPLALIGNAEKVLPLARRHHFAWIHAQHGSLTPSLTAQAHEDGIAVTAWTVDDPATLPAWQAMKLEKLCTNRPSVMLAALR